MPKNANSDEVFHTIECGPIWFNEYRPHLVEGMVDPLAARPLFWTKVVPQKVDLQNFRNEETVPPRARASLDRKGMTMATGADLLAYAKRHGWNPFIFGFCVDTGAASPDKAFLRDRGTNKFIAWNAARWAEHPPGAKSFGTVGVNLTVAHADLIARYLGAKLDEFLRRNA